MVARTGFARGSVATSSWTRWIISVLLIGFMVSDAIPKILNLDFAASSTIDLGYPERVVVPIGIVLLVSTILYALPRTAFVGAILLTGYLGGAIATQVRLEDPWFLFPVTLAVLTWIGLALRDPKVSRMLGI